MNFKTTYLLFALLVVLIGALVVVLVSGPGDKGGTSYLFPSMHAKEDPVKAKDIIKVVLTRSSGADGRIVFERTDDNTWKITEPRSLAADSPRVNNMVESIIEARLSEEEAPKSLSKTGLEKPSRVVTLYTKDKDWTLNVGETTMGGMEHAHAFVTTNERKTKPLAVKKSAIESALEGLAHFRGKDLLGDNVLDVRGITVTQGKKPTVELRKEKDRWVMKQPPYGTVEGADIVSKLGDLRIDHRNEKDSDFVKDGVEAGKLAEYNLDPAKDEVLRIAVTRGEGKSATTTTAVVGVGKEVKDQKKYYATVEDGKTRDVVKVGVESVKAFKDLIDDPGKLRSKSLLALDGFKQPDAIDVRNSWGDLEFRKPENAKGWELYRDKTNTPVEDNEVRQLVEALNKKDVISSFEDPSKKKELGLEKPDVVVKVWADALDKPDPKTPGKPVIKKDAKPAAELRFGNRVRGMVAVERVWDGDAAIALVPESLLDQVRKGPLAYADKAIPKFNPGRSDQDVTKIEITRGGETLEVTRATEKDPWTFTKPANLKGRKASTMSILNVLDDLNSLRAEEIVAEKPDAKDMTGTYELAKPPVRVVVTMTKDKKDTTQTFDLGKETPRGVYFKRGDKEMVYLINQGILGAIKKELRDTSVFNFDPDKVTSLTVKGWNNLFGSVHVLSFEKKDGNWVVKAPPMFNLDGNKATDVVRELSRLQAEKFVPSGKGLKPAEGALEIEVGLPDKQTATLTVGEMDGVNYFATSDQLKGEVVLIPRGLFEEMKKAPVFFAKK